MNNESSLLINSPFALRQQNLKPVFTQIETTERPYTDSEINDLMSKQLERDRKAGLKDKKIKHHCYIYLKFLKEHNNKIEEKKDYPIDLHTLERIIITPNAKGYISTAFLEYAKKYSIPIYWIDGKGMIESCFMPTYFKRTSLIIKQCESRISGKNIKIAKYLIKLKLESEGMEQLIPKLDKAKNIKDILQIEGNASRSYYQQWSFSDEWNWKGRHGKTSINANAIDPINSILNLGYSLLAQQMSEILLKRGFELSIGFMHNSETSKNYWNMLSYDMIEPFRTCVDEIIKEMIAENKIKPNDFVFTDDRSHMMLKDIKIALNRFMNMLSPLEHKSLPMIREIEGML